MGKYITNILIAFDQFLFTLFGGYPDETFSSACYRYRNKHRIWKIIYLLVNSLFFWQKNHCFLSYESEKKRAHLPKEYLE